MFSINLEPGVAYGRLEEQPHIIEKFIKAYPDCRPHFEERLLDSFSNGHAKTVAKLLNGGPFPKDGSSGIISMRFVTLKLDESGKFSVLTCLSRLLEEVDIDIVNVSAGAFRGESNQAGYDLLSKTYLSIAKSHTDSTIVVVAAGNEGLPIEDTFVTTPQDLCRQKNSANNIICVSGGRVEGGVIKTKQNYGDSVHAFLVYNEKNSDLPSLLDKTLYPKLAFTNTSEMAPLFGFIAREVKKQCGLSIHRENIEKIFKRYIERLPLTVPFRSKEKILTRQVTINTDFVLRDLYYGNFCP